MSPFIQNFKTTWKAGTIFKRQSESLNKVASHWLLALVFGAPALVGAGLFALGAWLVKGSNTNNYISIRGILAGGIIWLAGAITLAVVAAGAWLLEPLANVAFFALSEIVNLGISFIQAARGKTIRETIYNKLDPASLLNSASLLPIDHIDGRLPSFLINKGFWRLIDKIFSSKKSMQAVPNNDDFNNLQSAPNANSLQPVFTLPSPALMISPKDFIPAAVTSAKFNIEDFFKAKLMETYNTAKNREASTNTTDVSSNEGLMTALNKSRSYANAEAPAVIIYEHLESVGGHIIINVRGDNACGIHALITVLILNQMNPDKNFLSWVTIHSGKMILNIPNTPTIELCIPKNEIKECAEGKDIIYYLLKIAQTDNIKALKTQAYLNEAAQLSFKIFFKYLFLNIMNQMEKSDIFNAIEYSEILKETLRDETLEIKQKRLNFLFHPTKGMGIETEYFQAILQILKITTSLKVGSDNNEEIKSPTIFTEDRRHYKLALPQDQQETCIELCNQIPELNLKNDPFFKTSSPSLAM